MRGRQQAILVTTAPRWRLAKRWSSVSMTRRAVAFSIRRRPKGKCWARWPRVASHCRTHRRPRAIPRLLLPAVQVVVIGGDEQAQQLVAMATARYAVNKAVITLRHEQVTRDNLPPVLAETLPALPTLGEQTSFAVVCKENTCQPPTSDGEALLKELSEV